MGEADIVCQAWIVVWDFRVSVRPSRRLDFSAMFHTGIVCVIRHSWDLIGYYGKGLLLAGGCS